MYIRGKDYKTVFILGAGATRGAIKHVLHKRKRIRPPLNGDFFKVAEVYSKAHGNNSAEMKRYKHLNFFFREILPFDKNPTMEDAFSCLYIAKDFPKIYQSGSGRRQSAGKRSEIEDFLKLTFGILTMLDYKTSNSTYNQLVDKLSSQDVIITLNYDTVLDSALIRKGWDTRTGYCITGNKQKTRWQITNGQLNPNLKDVKLLKLHGSLNWYVRGNYHKLSGVFEKKPVKILKPRKNEVAKHIRQIIPPIYGKFFAHSHWQRLWEEAYKAMCNSDILVVIGCSLVDTDFHLKSFISRVSQHRKKNDFKFKKIILADRIQVRRKWEKILKGAFQVSIGYNKFQKFIKETKT